MESGLIFNQLICEFESRHPCQVWANAECDYIFECSKVTLHYLSPVYVGRSSTAEHRTVTAAHEGSTPFDPPKFLARNCGRGVRHLIVDQADDGSSPFSSANNFGVWCNVRIRVLGTRGDSSTLSSPTNSFFAEVM